VPTAARSLPHRLLTSRDLPASRAPFDEIVAFAYTYDAYAELGLERCGALANETMARFLAERLLPDDLPTLRACLYFEARRWIVLEREPDTRSRLYVDALLERIGDVADAQGDGALPLPLGR
jgi:hypothetical protein